MKKIPQGPSVKPIHPRLDVMKMYKASELSSPVTAAELFVWSMIDLAKQEFTEPPGDFFKIAPTITMNITRYLLSEAAKEEWEAKAAATKAAITTAKADRKKENLVALEKAVQEEKDAHTALEATYVPVSSITAEEMKSLEDEDREFVEMLQETCKAAENAKTRLHDLTFCYMIKGFKDSNLKNYYTAAKMKVQAQPLMEYVHYNSSTPFKILENADIQTRVASIEWTRYHSSLSSTVGLIEKVMHDFKGQHAAALWDALDTKSKTWYEEARDPANRFTPTKFSDPPTDLVAFCAIYLTKTGGYPPNKWWQADAAMSKVGEAFRVKAELVAEMMVASQAKLVKMAGDKGLAIASMSHDVSAEAKEAILNNAATLTIKTLEDGIKAQTEVDNDDLFKKEYEGRKGKGKAKV
jgi:hypothetical protein